MNWFTDLLRTTPPAQPQSEVEPQADDPRLKALRFKAMADALKNRQEMPEGKMVSGRYVAPHWSQQLSTALGNTLGAYAGVKGAEESFRAEKEDEQAAQNWVTQRPTDRQVTIPGRPGVAAEDDLTMGYGTPAIPDQTVTVTPSEEEMSKWIGSGMKRPLSRALATKVFEEHVAKKPERDLQRAAALDKIREQGAQRIQELQMRLEDRNLDREQRAALQQQLLEAQERMKEFMGNVQKEIAAGNQRTQLAVGAGHDAARIQAAEIARDARVQAAADKAAAGGKPVPQGIVKELNGSREKLMGIRDSFQTFKPEYGGLGGAVDKFSGTWNPLSGKSAEEAANWWKTYNNQAALVERHEKFGTALSGGEQQAWRDATISPGMKAETIRKNLAVRANLARKVFNKDRDSYIKAGHKGIEDAFEREPVIFDPNTMKRMGDKIYQKTGPNPTDWEEVD